MRCGEKIGHMTAKDTLCKQPIPAGAGGCIWYMRTPEERSLPAMHGASGSLKEAAGG
jgi:hypothetical protein